MPIAVMCPSCSANFSVKDELAGKRAKCPKCGEPLTIPGGAPVAPTATPAVAVPAAVAKPVATRPVAVPVKPTDNADDRPRGKQRRDDAEEDDRSRDKKRRDDDADEGRTKGKRRQGDDEDDKTKGKRRRRDDDDDQPKKKSKALPIILGILGGLVLICGGGCAGVYFFILVPANDRLQALGSSRMSVFDQDKNQQKQRPAEEPPAVTMNAVAFFNLKEAERKQYDGKWVQLTGSVPTMRSNSYPNKPEDGWVDLGSARLATVTCHFGPTEWAVKPKFDDEKDYTVIGLHDNKGNVSTLTWCRVVGELEREPATKVAMADLLTNTARYQGQMVEVEGVVQSAKFERGLIQTVLANDGAPKSVRFGMPPDMRDVIAGDRVTVKGQVDRDQGGFVDLKFRKIVSRTPGSGPKPQDPSSDPSGPVVTTDDAMIQAFIKDITSPDRMYKGKQVKLTGKVADMNGNTLYFGGKLDSNFAHWVEVKTVGGVAVKKGDTITVVGKYKEYSSSFQNSSRTITLTDGKVEGVTPAKPESPPAEVISKKAEDLAAEFDADPAGATKKYQDKTVTVTGSVEQVTPTGSIVTLKGVAATGAKKATVITVLINSDTRDEAKKLKPGDSVKLTGKLSGMRAGTTSRPNTVTINSGTIEK